MPPKANPPEPFALRLRHLRESAGLSQRALASKIEMSSQALSLLELGQTQPLWATVQRLADALGVSTEEMR